jgi:hypothetical protein
MAPIDLRVDRYGIEPAFPVDYGGRIRCAGSVDARVIHRKRIGSRKVRSWRLTWERTGSGQEWHARRAFQAAGKHQAMNFYPPDGGGIVLVRFVDDLEIERTSSASWRFTMELEELIR